MPDISLRLDVSLTYRQRSLGWSGKKEESFCLPTMCWVLCYANYALYPPYNPYPHFIIFKDDKNQDSEKLETFQVTQEGGGS